MWVLLTYKLRAAVSRQTTRIIIILDGFSLSVKNIIQLEFDSIFVLQFEENTFFESLVTNSKCYPQIFQTLKTKKTAIAIIYGKY